MRDLKLLTVVGARPQFVKAAALSPALAARSGVTELLVHTGQHFDANMSDRFFEEMSIPPPYRNLGIGGGTHGQNTGRMIEALEGVMLETAPDAVIVFGDTDSTLAAAIAASKIGVLLAHVEAGLRSFRRAMPEEINRVVTDHVSDVLYAPSASAVAHLEREGVPAQRIVYAGDVMYDVVKRFSAVAAQRSTVLERLGLRAGGYCFMTLHRKENTDDAAVLARILQGIAAAGVPIVFPVHPRTARRIAEFGLALPPNVQATEPLGYLDTMRLQAGCRLVLTDSGGVQKEAFFHGVPCVTLRDETEWTELVDCGANVLVGSDARRIAELVGNPWRVVDVAGIYGDGHAAELIVADLLGRLQR